MFEEQPHQEIDALMRSNPEFKQLYQRHRDLDKKVMDAELGVLPIDDITLDEQGLKGCTTFRFNPAAFQGVLVKEADLENTTYRFELEDGSVVEVKGNEQIEYDGEMHTAANLFDALKEGYYGKF